MDGGTLLQILSGVSLTIGGLGIYWSVRSRAPHNRPKVKVKLLINEKKSNPFFLDVIFINKCIYDNEIVGFRIHKDTWYESTPITLHGSSKNMKSFEGEQAKAILQNWENFLVIDSSGHSWRPNSPQFINKISNKSI